VDLEVAIVGVGLAGEQAFEFALRGLRMELFERRLGLLDDTVVALGLGQLDELDRVLVALLDAPIAANQVFEPVALADQLLRRRRIVPELGILGPAGQLVKPSGRDIPVKDASAAGRAISRCRRSESGFPHASLIPSIFLI
jgi:hypothetical protein